MKKIISLLLVICLAACIFAGCDSSTDPVDKNKALASTDKYRNFYQIWIGSFADSNDDEVGDFQGIISQLDYLNDGDPDSGYDLGVDGIWLSPMMPSYSYHKYNVENYFDIDKDFGTLDDFDQFMSECNDRGIKVIIDLVLNHSASNHPYFLKACEELKDGKEDGYAKYYNFSKEKSEVYSRPVTGTDYYYEGEFTAEMPDWNLSYEGTRDYFEEIVKFWIDRGVAGFRLDAVKYFTDDNTDGNEFLTWLYDMAKGYKEDVYMVGEDWEEAGIIYDKYETGIDSMFNFKFAGTDGAYISTARSGLMKDFVNQLKKFNDNIKKRNEDAINANFLTNHDMVRVYNMLEEDEMKMAASLYMLSPGNSYTYYGEEIGIEAPNTTNDASYRTPMIWDNDNLPGIYVSGVAEVEKTELGGVKQQLVDDNSLLSTYRRLIKIKNENPEIARGDILETVEFDNTRIAGYIVEYDGSKLMIVHNGNDEETTVDLDVDSAELRGDVVATASKNADENSQDLTENADKTAFSSQKQHVSLSNNKLTMPPMSSAVLKIS